MRTTLLLLALLAGPVLAGQTVWKWVDESGVTHYADRPVPGAVRMEVNTGRSSSESESSNYGATTNGTSPPPADVGPVYRDFEIWKPGNDETIPNTGGAVTVNLRLNPALQPGHSIYLYLDGGLVEGFAENATSFDLKEVPRGTHQVRAVINDGRGTRVQETAPVSFTVRQESVAQPPVGPALRPPPKPQPRPRVSNKLPTSQPSYAALNGGLAAIDPVTNRPVVTKPATTKPKTPGPRQGK